MWKKRQVARANDQTRIEQLEQALEEIVMMHRSGRCMCASCEVAKKALE
jgi:hypothetical protein